MKLPLVSEETIKRIALKDVLGPEWLDSQVNRIHKEQPHLMEYLNAFAQLRIEDIAVNICSSYEELQKTTMPVQQIMVALYLLACHHVYVLLEAASDE